MKVSEISIEDIIDYLRISDISSKEKQNFRMYLDIAKNYIENYTGIPRESENAEDETLDSYSAFCLVDFILCQDMYDNRCMYVDGKNINNTVKTILDMHSRNNL